MDDATKREFKQLIAGATLMLTGVNLSQLGGIIVIAGVGTFVLGVFLLLEGYFEYS